MAVLYLSEKSATYPIGTEFSEDVLVDTQGDNVNVVQAIITFDPNDFSVTIDNSKSVFPFQAFSIVENGKITIVRGIPTVSINDPSAIVSTLKIKNLRKTIPLTENFVFLFTLGDASFSNAILNDGLGTLCLTEVVNSTFKTKKKSDLNGDGLVNSSDSDTLLSLFGDTSNLTADINGDGKTDIKDLSILLSEWD